MNQPVKHIAQDTGLSPDEIERMRSVFRRVPAIGEVVLYGSRAKGTHRPGSDIDLALVGLDDPLQAEAVAEELDELPTPYRFDVKAYGSIADGPLREHIVCVGVSLYRRDPPGRAEAKAAKSA
jgi:predicted nucleotidyltransferase